MVNVQKDKVATQNFVLRATTASEERIEEKIENLEKKMDNRFDKVMNHLDKVISYFTKFDEEHTILTETNSRNTNRIEKLEKAVFKTI